MFDKAWETCYFHRIITCLFSNYYANNCLSFLIEVLNTLADDALDSEDFAPLHNVSVSVNSHQTKAVNISIMDDIKFEQDEDFYVEITGADAGDGVRVVNVTISDNDRKLF